MIKPINIYQNATYVTDKHEIGLTLYASQFSTYHIKWQAEIDKENAMHLKTRNTIQVNHNGNMIGAIHFHTDVGNAKPAKPTNPPRLKNVKCN